MTDRELLNQYVQAGSKDAMCELVRRHSGMVHATALRELGDSHLADDVTQSVFIVLMRRARELTGRETLGGWLFKTTLYATADMRRQRRRREFHEREAAVNKPVESPPDQANHDEMRPLLNAAITRLRSDDRDAILLRYLEGRPISEVATGLGITENTARQRIFRALERLRKEITVASSTASAAGITAFLESAHAQAAPALNQSLEALMRGASPAPHVEILAKGVIHMLHAKWLAAVGLGVGAIAVAGLCATLAAVEMNHHPAAPAAAPQTSAAVNKEGPLVTSTAPDGGAASPLAAAPARAHGPAATPKGTLAAAFEAANTGDAAGLVACFAPLTDLQSTKLKEITEAFSDYNALMLAVETRFGADARKQMDPGLLGVSQKDVDGSQEQLAGGNAIVDMGNAGPGKISMVKDGPVWKIDPAVIDTLNPQALQAVLQALPTVQQMTDDIKAGKYATVADAQRALTVSFPWLTAPPASRPGAAPPASAPHDLP